MNQEATLSSDKRLKVLLSAYSCRPGWGSEPGVGWNTAKALSRLHDVWVITREWNKPAIEEELARNPLAGMHFEFMDLPMMRRRIPSPASKLYYYIWQLLSYLFVARRLHRRIGFHVCHHVTLVRYWMPSLLWRLPVPFLWGPVGGGETVPRQLRKILSMRSRFAELTRDVARWLGERDPLLRRTARNSFCALATTEDTAERLRGLGCRRIEVKSAIALDDSIVGGLARSVGSSSHRQGIRFLSVGRLVGLKGYDLSLRAFAQAKIPHSEYHIIGDGPERRRLEEEARRLGVERKVVFLGKVPREVVFREMSEADVLLHPSMRESGSYACLEGMAAALPVLCLDLSGPGAMIDEQVGIKVKAVTPERVIQGLSTGMVRLYREPALLRRLGQEGRERVAALYLWSEKANQISQIYSQMLLQQSSSEVDSARAAV